MLRDLFLSLASPYTSNQQLSLQLWQEVERAYSQPDRHFHNLVHLQQMFAALQPLQQHLEDWETLAFALFYHDVVYDVVQYVTENDNEDQSAARATEALQTLGYPSEKILRCQHHILATKSHKPSTDTDSNFLTDADLSILGQPWDVYEAYMKAIRQEYLIYPDAIYNAGRANVLKGFQKMERLFKTAPFQEQYEAPARENIERELEILSFY